MLVHLSEEMHQHMELIFSEFPLKLPIILYPRKLEKTRPEREKTMCKALVMMN